MTTYILYMIKKPSMHDYIYDYDNLLYKIKKPSMYDYIWL